MKTTSPKNNAIVAKETSRNWHAWQHTQHTRQQVIINAILLAAIIGLILFALHFQRHFQP